MVYEDFTDGWIEVDTGNNRIQFTANHVDHAATRNEDTYLYKDYGAGHFGDFVHKIDFQSGFDTASGRSIFCMYANSINDWWGIYQANETCFNVNVYANGGTRIWLEEAHAGIGYASNMIAISADTPYYLRIEKSGTSLICDIYSTLELRDAGSGSDGDVGTLSLTLQADHQLRYLFACNTRNDGAGTYIINTDIDNLDLQEALEVNPSAGSIVPIMRTLGML